MFKFLVHPYDPSLLFSKGINANSDLPSRDISMRMRNVQLYILLGVFLALYMYVSLALSGGRRSNSAFKRWVIVGIPTVLVGYILVLVGIQSFFFHVMESIVRVRSPHARYWPEGFNLAYKQAPYLFYPLVGVAVHLVYAVLGRFLPFGSFNSDNEDDKTYSADDEDDDGAEGNTDNHAF